MDIEISWEKKVLIFLGIIALVIVIYAYNPFQGTREVIVANESTTPQTPRTMPFNVSSNDNNNTNQTPNNVNITSQQAKEIASLPGFRTGEPVSGTLKVNNENVPVWIVPLYQENKLAKEVYVNRTDGIIVATKEFN